MPLEAQIRAREAFIERSKKRIEQHDVEHAANQVQRLEESQKRLEELRAMVPTQPIAPTPANGVGFATTIAGPSCTIGRLSIQKSEEGGLRSHHGGGGLGVVDRLRPRPT